MNLNIAVLAGDGIGPEVIEQAIKVVDAVRCCVRGVKMRRGRIAAA